jgi:hypothetical protein
MNRELPDGAQYEPIDENGDQPVTGAEFHDAMRSVGRSFERVESNVAQIRADMATKDELVAMEDRLAQQIKASGEIIVKTLSQHIDSAVKSAVDRRFTQHELRLSRLEEQAGFSPAA